MICKAESYTLLKMFQAQTEDFNDDLIAVGCNLPQPCILAYCER